MIIMWSEEVIQQQPILKQFMAKLLLAGGAAEG